MITIPRGEAVEPVDEVDRVGDHHDGEHGDERREVGRQHDVLVARERHPEVEHRHAEQRQDAAARAPARRSWPAVTPRAGRRSRRRRTSPRRRAGGRAARSRRRTSRGTGRAATPRAIATRNPTNIAAPPSDGVGFVCTLRGPGIAIAPMRGASQRITNVKRNVTTGGDRRRR